MLFLAGLQASVGEAGKLQRRPEPVAAGGEIMARDDGGRRGIDAAKYHVEAFGKDVRLVVGQGGSRVPTSRVFYSLSIDRG